MQVSPQVTKADDIVTINDNGTSVTVAPSVIGRVSYSNRSTFVREAGAGDWTPTPVSDIIATDADVIFVRGTTVIARISRRFSFNTLTDTFSVTTTTHPDGDLNVSRVTVGAASSSSVESTVLFAYSHEGEIADITPEIDIIKGGLRW